MSFFDNMNVTEEEMDKHLDEWVKKIQEEEAEKEKFRQEHQDEVMELVYQHLTKHGSVDDEDMLYFPQKYAFSNRDFNWLFSNLKEYAETHKKAGTDEECGFWNQVFSLKHGDLNIEMHIMSGQGTAIWMQVSEGKFWNEKLSFTYEEYKNAEPIDTSSEEYRKEERFDKFIEELTELGHKYGIVIQSMGGVTILSEEMTHIHYEKDWKAGNLTPRYWNSDNK